MALETATFISQLVAANPTATDPQSQGDDQLRMTKLCLLNTFLNFTAAPLLATQAQLDKLVTAVAVNAAAGAGSVVVDASGKVGVGMIGGIRTLNVLSQSNQFTDMVLKSNSVNGGSGAGALYFGNNSSDSLGFISYDTQANTLSMGTSAAGGAGVERMRIDSSGVLLIGRTTNVGVGAKVVVENGGNGIHTNTPNNSSAIAFHVGGAQVGSCFVTSTTTTFNTASDYRLKLDQAPLVGSAAFIDALQPKTWQWKQDGSRGAGFIAHEFQAVSPTSVSGVKDAVDEDGKPVYQSMQASSAEVMANVIAELQSLRARVAALETGHIA